MSRKHDHAPGVGHRNRAPATAAMPLGQAGAQRGRSSVVQDRTSTRPPRVCWYATGSAAVKATVAAPARRQSPVCPSMLARPRRRTRARRHRRAAVLDGIGGTSGSGVGSGAGRGGVGAGVGGGAGGANGSGSGGSGWGGSGLVMAVLLSRVRSGDLDERRPGASTTDRKPTRPRCPAPCFELVPTFSRPHRDAGRTRGGLCCWTSPAWRRGAPG
jgi:hypothetical protein